MFSKPILVLECAASRLALASFSRSRGRIKLESHEAVELAVTPEITWLQAIGDALMALGKRVPLRGPVTLVLPPHLVLTKFIRTPRVEAAKLAKVIRFEAETSIPYALTDVTWGSAVAAEHDHEQEVLLAAAKLEPVDALCVAVQAAGFEPRLLLPSPLATLAAFRLVQDETREPALVLNLGARSTTLVHVEGPRFVLRTAAVGSRCATRQPVGNDGPDSAETGQILAARLAQEIVRSVLHFRRQSGMPDPGRVYLTGGGAGLPGLGESLAARLKLPVERLNFPAALEIADGAVRNNVPADAPLMLTDLAGAAATRLRPGQPVVNLLPPRLLRHESRRRRRPWLIVAALLVLLTPLPPLLHFRALAVAAGRKTDAIERELAPLREREARNRANLQQLAELRQQAAQLRGIHDRRSAWLGLFADLQDRLAGVEDVWLDRMMVASAPGAPLKLAVSGRMLDRSNPLAKVSPETFIRARALLAGIVDSPFVAGVEAERFDNERPGILKFDFVLVADPARPL
jgi:type IV pilus assembly protein PilM